MKLNFFFFFFFFLFILIYYRYLDNKVFVSLANGDITVYSRDHSKSYINFIRKEKNKNIVKYKRQVYKVNLV